MSHSMLRFDFEFKQSQGLGSDVGLSLDLAPPRLYLECLGRAIELGLGYGIEVT